MDCSICHIKIDKVAFVTLKCEHKLHLICFFKNIEIGITKDKCPLCRRSIDIPQKILNQYSSDELSDSETVSLSL